MSYRMDRSGPPSSKYVQGRSRPRTREHKESPPPPPQRRGSPFAPRNDRKEVYPPKKKFFVEREPLHSDSRGGRGGRGSAPRPGPPPSKKRYRSNSPEMPPKGRKSFSPPKYRQSPPRDPSPPPMNRKHPMYRQSPPMISERPKYQRSPSPEPLNYKRSESSSYRHPPPSRGDPHKYRRSLSNGEPSLKNIKRQRRSRSLSFENDRKLQGRSTFRGPEGVPYTLNDLKKLSVDIKRNIPGGGSITVQKNTLSTEKIVVVRRRGEGSRPIFDRAELKESQKEKIRHSSTSPPPYKVRRRSDDMYERVVAMMDNKGGPSGPRYDSPPQRYGSDRPRGEYYREPEGLGKFDDHMKSKRYRNDDPKYDYEGFPRGSGRSDDTKGFYRGEPERDRSDKYMDDRYADEKLKSHRPAAPYPYSRSPDNSAGRIPVHVGDRPSYQQRSSSFRGGASESSSFRRDSSKFSPLPEDSARNWDFGPEYVPKGRSYFEHDNRESFSRSPRSRGLTRGRISSRGNTRRGTRGYPNSRGSYVSQGSRSMYRGSGRRGGGYVRRQTTNIPRSSSSWSHDLYSKIIEEDKK